MELARRNPGDCVDQGAFYVTGIPHDKSGDYKQEQPLCSGSALRVRETSDCDDAFAALAGTPAL